MESNPLTEFKQVCLSVLRDHIKTGGDIGSITRKFITLASESSTNSILTNKIENDLTKWKDENPNSLALLVSLSSRILFKSKEKNIDLETIRKSLSEIGEELSSAGLIDVQMDDIKKNHNIVELLYSMLAIDVELYSKLKEEVKEDE